MTDWKAFLKEETITWLLEKNNPSVRYLTLINILHKKKTDPEAKDAKEDIMLSGVVPKILNKQRAGSWNRPGRFYVDKYKGSVWQLIILAEHEADSENKQVRDACEYILSCSQDPESFGFAYNQRGGNGGGRHSEVVPCLTGNMIWSLIELGYLRDERVQKGTERIARYQRFDDGADAHPEGWPYDRYEMCWGKHSGVVKALKALSVIPKGQRNRNVRSVIEKGCDYLLAHRIYKQSHNLSMTAKPGWLKLQFPLMYQTDILESALILLDLAIKDDRMRDAIDKIASKQNKEGKWNLEGTFNGMFQVNIEVKDRPSKWITYRALNVIKKYYETKNKSLQIVEADPLMPSCR